MVANAIFVREEGNVWLPIYYISHFMVPVETRYSRIKKLALALLIVLRKLKPYFQTHVIVVLTKHPLKQVLHCFEASDRLIKWSMELS